MMNPRTSLRTIVFLWLGWAVAMLAFQQVVSMRLHLRRPDGVLSWTASETAAGSQNGKPYLLDPFLNEHVSWDSEFYLSVATDGYDDPAVRAISGDFIWYEKLMCVAGTDADCHSLNYAFFPLYSFAARLVAFPLRVLALTPIARSTLAAMIVSLLGTLGAMLGLYAMSRSALGEDGGVRAAFYLLIFPSGFFLAQVYAEGLYIGLIFGALACLSARKWGWTAVLAALAVWTRPGGALLLLPMAMVWFMDKSWRAGWRDSLLRALAVLTPAVAYAIWASTHLAREFFLVEKLWFGRGLLSLGSTFLTWGQAIQSMFQGNPATTVYYLLEFGAIALAVVACLLLWKERPEISAYGLAIIAFAFTTGSAQGMVRYVLPAAPLFWVLARWGQKPAFDRIWSLASVLLMGMEATLFSFDSWVA